MYRGWFARGKPVTELRLPGDRIESAIPVCECTAAN